MAYFCNNMNQSVSFPSGTVEYVFQSAFRELWGKYDRDQAIVITNNDIAGLYSTELQGIRTITIPAGEQYKDLSTVADIARQLLAMQATKRTLLIGLGGGVITDITGFISAVYMRGVATGFVPTTLLGMVDAAVGGKNGVNVGLNKNIIGTIRQPKFVLYDTNFLRTLPDEEWSNGFAEIIKYACIFDEELFATLSKNNLKYYQQNAEALNDIVQRCVGWKNRTVLEDEQESGIRKLLNFGHTVGHAIENLYALAHGQAVAIGMVIACKISERHTGLAHEATAQLEDLLRRYNLPTSYPIAAKKAMDLLKMDKKRDADMIDYIMLERIGRGTIAPIKLHEIENALEEYESNN